MIGTGYRRLELGAPELASPRVAVPVAVALGAAVGVAAVFLPPWALLAGLVGLCLGAAILRSALLGLITLVGVASLLPFAVIPIRIGVQITLIDATLSAVLLVWVGARLTRHEPVEVSPIGLPLFAFIGVAVAAFVLGSAYSMTPELARLFLKLINSILVFFSALNVVRTVADLRLVMRAMTLFGFAAAGIGVGLYMLPQDTIVRVLSSLRVVGYPSGYEVLRPIAGTTTLRATATSIDPNVLGGLLMLAAATTLGQFFAPRPVLPRKWLAPMIGTMVGATVLTYSRSSWVGLAAAAGFLATFRYRRAWVVFFVAALGLFLTPTGHFALERFVSGVLGQDQAAAMRLGEYHDALRLISSYPFFGVGFGEAPRVDLYVAVSSIYLLIGEEMGLVGLGLFLLTMGLLYFCVWRGLERAKDPEVAGIAVSLLTALSGALTAGLFDHYFFNIHFPHTAALFWLYAGLSMAAARIGTTAPADVGRAADERSELPSG